MSRFKGDKKVGGSFFTRFERPFVARTVHLVPAWLETYHLTLLTIAWSGMILLFSYLAAGDLRWLWGVSAMIFLQYLTDLYDGAIGRHRKTGLIKWGYYMDHFLDYVFLCAILIGYSFITPASSWPYLFFILAICGAYMVDAYLSFAATNEFRIDHLGIGPTEMRLVFIIINSLLIFFGKTYLAGALPWVLVLSALGLCVVAYRTSKRLWEMDMKIKKAP